MKLFGITGLLVIAISCFANNKDVQQALNIALKNSNYSDPNTITGVREHNATVDLINHDQEVIDLIIKADDIQIGGTLILPSNLETSSLVIMSSGSGDQDRDETLEGFKIFKVIADHLASKGI